MIILDTNVISALMRQTPEPSVVRWLDLQPRTSLWITSITVFEIRFGLQILEPGKRRTFLQQAFEVVLEKISYRIASFDGDSAQQAADLAALRRRKGRPVDLRDTMIAGIVLANNATLSTGNTSHFQDISAKVVNPWTL
ncbi:MAG TPA: type II toxin-antitoxin system VapC family toxin [Candidatus Angelobacter sp.]|nr:type II toxin-antitoxin system VapC family toxin [Candidatus Angelobacter sp.]